MGIYLNPNNVNFQKASNSKIYVDKSGLISYTNKVMLTEQQFICVSRPRRFGKSMAANMLCAYYSRGCDSREMFKDLKISKEATFEKHLNKYNVIHVDIQEFLSETKTMVEMIGLIATRLTNEIKRAHKEIDFYETGLVPMLKQSFAETGIPFIFIIDEWDSIFRVHQNDFEAQKQYLDFLRNLLKGQSYVALAYMTGILPIKKYGQHSALNMFREFSMTNASPIQQFTGFTEEEVKELCERYSRPFEDMKRWYDGYILNGVSLYNPRSVVESLLSNVLDNYWTQTETFEALTIYIRTNIYGVQDVITKLLAGETYEVDVTTFQNDMTSLDSLDRILTLLVHLGYLAYDFDTKTVRIPNHEIRQQFISTVREMGWSNVVTALKNSEELLKATFACNEKKVAELIEAAHQENTAILKYNDENSLSCVMSLAYYSAKKSYTMVREMPTGKGFADLVFIPNGGVTTPAMVVELKHDKTAETALQQI